MCKTAANIRKIIDSCKYFGKRLFFIGKSKKMLSILHLICNFADECIAKLGHPLHFLEYSLKMKSHAIKMTQKPAETPCGISAGIIDMLNLKAS